jgi:hypothetical protein
MLTFFCCNVGYGARPDATANESGKGRQPTEELLMMTCLPVYRTVFTERRIESNMYEDTRPGGVVDVAH